MAQEIKTDRPQIENEYDLVAQELCDARSHALEFLDKMKLASSSMDRYLDNLLLLINDATSGNVDTVDVMEGSVRYKNCFGLHARFDKFIEREKRKAEKRKLSPDVPYEHEVILCFPKTAAGIAKIKREISRYREVKPIVSRRHDETTVALKKRSRQLPITYVRYSERGAAYAEKIEGIETNEEKLALLFRTFPELRRRYAFDFKL